MLRIGFGLKYDIYRPMLQCMIYTVGQGEEGQIKWKKITNDLGRQTKNGDRTRGPTKKYWDIHSLSLTVSLQLISLVLSLSLSSLQS